jgi:hypothetical protein
MPTYPSRTETLRGQVVATLRDALNERDIPQGYRNTILLQLLLRAQKDEGLTVQGQPKIPGVSVRRRTQGGRAAEVFVSFDEGQTAMAFGGYDILKTSMSGGPTVTTQEFAAYTCMVQIAGTEKAKNSGKMKRLDLLLSAQGREIRKLLRTMEVDLWGTNGDTAEGTQKKFSGIGHKVQADPTGSSVVQGINQSTFETWRNVTNNTVGSFAANGLDAFRAAWFDSAGVNGMEPIQLWLTTRAVASLLTKALEGIHRVVGRIGQQDLSTAMLPTHMGVPFCHTDDCPAGVAKGINFDYVENVVHEQMDWEEVRPGTPNDQWVLDQQRWVYAAAPMMVTRREKMVHLGGITA